MSSFKADVKLPLVEGVYLFIVAIKNLYWAFLSDAQCNRSLFLYVTYATCTKQSAKLLLLGYINNKNGILIGAVPLLWEKSIKLNTNIGVLA